MLISGIKNKMKFFSTGAIILSASLILAGCATKVDLEKFHPANLNDADLMPSTDQLKQRRVKVVVFEANAEAVANIGKENEPVLSSVLSRMMGIGPQDDVNFGGIVTSMVEKTLTQTGVELVDRNLASDLSKVLKSGDAVTESSQVLAEFAISGAISSANSYARYVQAYSWKDDNGKDHTIAEHYTHSSVVTGSLKLFELSPVGLFKTFNLYGNASMDDPRRDNEYVRLELLKRATRNAVDDIVYLLKNTFAPKGYVLESRTNGKSLIFKVSMGGGQSAHAEDKVVIYSVKKKNDTLTGKEQIDEIQIGEATISNQITNEEAWVVPKNKDEALRVRRGDLVRVQYESPSILHQIFR
jgi:hypothetical protein